ncbi:hypothetical protein VTN31DRAFT_6266 [Thermomyces dupontii]|uniref:uncharacterized protein n=1 Tax=Talaromyces thermophilus TaxID=28565 RepID=UPI0037439927
MWKRSLLESSLLRLAGDGRCLSCQLRGVGGLLVPRRLASSGATSKQNSQTTSEPAKQDAQAKTSATQEGEGEEAGGDFTPLPLDRPIGLEYPPREGQNTGIDTRTLRERRDDFVNYEKHLQRRKELARQVAKPYFREWTNLRYHQGKTFLSNPRLFKRDKALYFPNLYGTTLASPKEPQNTTSILSGRVSVVGLFSSLWAEQQVATFLHQRHNPRLHEILARSGSVAQTVSVNVEENPMKAWLVKMFMWRLRRTLSPEQHDKYFLVRRGFTERLREAIGMMNSKVGYVYLLDDACHIRWAGSGNAEPSEIESLNNGLERLIEEKRKQTRLEAEARPADAKPRVVTR